jgi:hypothetical protein
MYELVVEKFPNVNYIRFFKSESFEEKIKPLVESYKPDCIIVSPDKFMHVMSIINESTKSRVKVNLTRNGDGQEPYGQEDGMYTFLDKLVPEEKKKIQLIHDNSNFIKLKFYYNSDLINVIKGIDVRKYDVVEKVWSIPSHKKVLLKEKLNEMNYIISE